MTAINDSKSYKSSSYNNYIYEHHKFTNNKNYVPFPSLRKSKPVRTFAIQEVNEKQYGIKSSVVISSSDTKLHETKKYKEIILKTDIKPIFEVTKNVMLNIFKPYVPTESIQTDVKLITKNTKESQNKLNDFQKVKLNKLNSKYYSADDLKSKISEVDNYPSILWEQGLETKKTKIYFNNSLKNKRHGCLRFEEEFRLIKMFKIMSFTETHLQDQYLKIFRKNNQLNLITYCFDKVKHIASENCLEPNSKKSVFLEKHNSYYQLNNYSVPKVFDRSPMSTEKSYEENLKTIRLRGQINFTLDCAFKFFFDIYILMTENLMSDIIKKEKDLYSTNARHHSQVIVHLNDFLVNEINRRFCKISVESSSKLGLFLLLDKIDNCFPAWNIWKNGCLDLSN